MYNALMSTYIQLILFTVIANQVDIYSLYMSYLANSKTFFPFFPPLSSIIYHYNQTVNVCGVYMDDLWDRFSTIIHILSI